jgi:hypothetical protein
MLTASSTSLLIGQTLQISVTLADAAGNVLTGRTIGWASSNAAVLTVSPTGLVTALGSGKATVTATSEGKSGSIALTVVAPAPAPVASVAVTVSGALAVGQTAQATAVLKDAAGNVLTGRAVSWASSAPAVAAVSAAGLVTALAAGAADVVATSEGQSGRAAVTVTAAAPAPPPSGPLPVVPGLVGFGTTTPAGRGGAVLRVTNLNDSGAGSLRAALLATGPRTVVFEVSGVITLQSRITLAEANSFLTVAGQTAPAPGITIRNYGIASRAHDLLIQHLRCRNGDASGVTDNDCFEEWQGYNVVLDHVSMSWAKDENVSSWPYNGPVRDMTVANSILTENMGSGSLLFGDNTANNLVIGSLLASNPDRDPYVKGGAAAAVVNNLIYNWCGNNPTATADPEGRGPAQMAVVGNVYKRGPSSPGASMRPIWVFGSAKAGTKVYVADNRDSKVNGGLPPADPWSLVNNSLGAAAVAGSPTVWPAGLVAAPSGAVEAAVLAGAGAWPAARDAVDARVVGQAAGGTAGACISSQSQVGGYTTQAPGARSAAAAGLPANPNGDDDGDGYTNLEEWLHALARAAEGR